MIWGLTKLKQNIIGQSNTILGSIRLVDIQAMASSSSWFSDKFSGGIQQAERRANTEEIHAVWKRTRADL